MVNNGEKLTFLISAALILGYLSWIGPRILIPGPDEGEFPILIRVSTNGDLALKVSIVCQVLTGTLLGYIDPRHPLLWGSLTMALVAGLALFDAVVGLSRHNLLPIELAMYILFTVPPISGAFLGKFLKWTIQRREK